ncbi:MAG: antitoxin AF2212-like protein [Candidatus Poribacteria bacterium]
MIEAKYVDEVLKPLNPIKGLRDNEKVWILIYRRSNKEALSRLAGTLTSEEAEEMRKIIGEEFERVENDW